MPKETTLKHHVVQRVDSSSTCQSSQNWSRDKQILVVFLTICHRLRTIIKRSSRISNRWWIMFSAHLDPFTQTLTNRVNGPSSVMVDSFLTHPGQLLFPVWSLSQVTSWVICAPKILKPSANLSTWPPFNIRSNSIKPSQQSVMKMNSVCTLRNLTWAMTSLHR